MPRQTSDGANGWCNQNFKFNDLTYIPRAERPNADLVEYFEKTNIRLEGQMLSRMLRSHFNNYFFEKKPNGKIRYQLFYVNYDTKKGKEVNPKDYEFIITKALGKNAPYKLNEKVIKDGITKMKIKPRTEESERERTPLVFQA